MESSKKYLITGGAGFLGQSLIDRLWKQNIRNLRVVGRNEGALMKLQERFHSVEIVPGDIADAWIAKKAMQGVAGVFHAAAFKHVGLAEEQSFQCVSSNVIGSLNILRESYQTRPDFVIGISTDKVAQVSGIYGATKLCMEALFREAESVNHATKYRIVRYGNIIKSTGSFLTKWEDKMRKGKEIIITDPEMTRFFWSVEEAVDAVFECLEKSPNATPWISKMKAISLRDALAACQKAWGSSSPIKMVGRQPGENLHETIDGKTFSNEVEQFSVEEFAKFL